MRVLACALTLAAGAALAGCTPEEASAPDPSPTAATPSGEATATAEPAATEPYPDRPGSTVEPWPDHGDFLVDVTKATVPAALLAQQERWDDHDLLGRITGTAQARWISSWSTDDAIRNYAHQVYAAASDQDRIGLISYYGLRDTTCEEAAAEPERADAYVERTRVLVEELPATGAQAWIVLEPGLVGDLGACEGDPRAAWVGEAAAIIDAAGGTVYLDAGVVTEPALVAEALGAVNLAHVEGIAVGTNGYRGASDQAAAGTAVVDAVGGGLGVIVDTSRSGVPMDEPEPCNPPEAGIGTAPRLVGEGALDAYVWIKRVGESDGACNGGASRGQFDQRLALELARQGVEEAS